MIQVLRGFGFAFAIAGGIGAAALAEGAGGTGMMARAEAVLAAESFLLALIGITLVALGIGVLRRLDALAAATAPPSARGTRATSRSPRGS